MWAQVAYCRVICGLSRSPLVSDICTWAFTWYQVALRACRLSLKRFDDLSLISKHLTLHLHIRNGEADNLASVRAHEVTISIQMPERSEADR